MHINLSHNRQRLLCSSIYQHDYPLDMLYTNIICNDPDRSSYTIILVFWSRDNVCTSEFEPSQALGVVMEIVVYAIKSPRRSDNRFRVIWANVRCLFRGLRGRRRCAISPHLSAQDLTVDSSFYSPCKLFEACLEISADNGLFSGCCIWCSLVPFRRGESKCATHGTVEIRGYCCEDSRVLYCKVWIVESCWT